MMRFGLALKGLQLRNSASYSFYLSTMHPFPDGPGRLDWTGQAGQTLADGLGRT
jgi:hypothetical protein